MKPRETASTEPAAPPPGASPDRAHVLQALAIRPGPVRANWERRELGARRFALAGAAASQPTD